MFAYEILGPGQDPNLVLTVLHVPTSLDSRKLTDSGSRAQIAGWITQEVDRFVAGTKSLEQFL